MAEVFDKRSVFFKSYFDKALKYSAYIESGTPQQKEKWQTSEGKLVLTAEQTKILASFKRKINILVLAGIWCGDCSRQGPMLELIAKTAPSIDCRFIDNQAYPELRDELRIAGGSRVPVAVVLSEDFFEVARFGDRHLSVYRRKAQNELGAACDPGLLPPPAEELNEELSEWFELIERTQLMLRLSTFLRNKHGD